MSEDENRSNYPTIASSNNLEHDAIKHSRKVQIASKRSDNLSSDAIEVEFMAEHYINGGRGRAEVQTETANGSGEEIVAGGKF
ncbi:hypothetical protein ACTXT7_000767 [Hymenolepis weldensis]